MIDYPTKRELMDAILEVLREYHTLHTSEINEKVAILLDLSDEQLQEESTNCSGTEYSYRMRWARTELKQKNLIINPQRGSWTLIKN